MNITLEDISKTLTKTFKEISDKTTAFKTFKTYFESIFKDEKCQDLEFGQARKQGDNFILDVFHIMFEAFQEAIEDWQIELYFGYEEFLKFVFKCLKIYRKQEKNKNKDECFINILSTMILNWVLPFPEIDQSYMEDWMNIFQEKEKANKINFYKEKANVATKKANVATKKANHYKKKISNLKKKYCPEALIKTHSSKKLLRKKISKKKEHKKSNTMIIDKEFYGSIFIKNLTLFFSQKKISFAQNRNKKKLSPKRKKK